MALLPCDGAADSPGPSPEGVANRAGPEDGTDMPLVIGVDSSTQSCKVVVMDAATGAIVRTGRASHPDGTEVDPSAWWTALQTAIADAGGLDDVAAWAIGGQQHGMVVLDS